MLILIIFVVEGTQTTTQQLGKLQLMDSLSLFFCLFRYRKSLDELQRNSDKKIALLTNATKKAEALVRISVLIYI